jgi:hypothetical protein
MDYWQVAARTNKADTGRPSSDRSRGTAAHHCAREATNGAQTKSVEEAQQREEEGLGLRPLGT